MTQTRPSVEFTMDDKTYKVYRPNMADTRASHKIRNSAFADALNSGAMLRAQINDVLRKRNLWNDEAEAKLRQLQSDILRAERRLEEGGFYLEEAREVAIKIKKLRADIREMLMERSLLENETAEGQADNASFNYLVSACTFLVYNDKEEPAFSSYEDYLNRSYEPFAFMAAQKLSGLTMGVGEDMEKQYPENQFLLEHKFVNDNLQYIDTNGHLVSEKGELINELGQRIDSEGNVIDINGNIVNDDGHYKVEKKPFLDKDGNPIEITPKVVVEEVKVDSESAG